MSILAQLAISMADNTDGVVDPEIPGVEGGEGEGGEDLAGTDTVEAALVDVAEADAAVDTEVAELDKLEDAHESLENYYIGLRAQAKKGGLSAGEATWMQAGIESIIKPWKTLTLKNCGMPSCESYKDGTKATWLTASCEGVKQMLKDFWQMIMNQINKVVAYIRNWYNKVLDAAPRLKKRAEALSEKAKDTNGTAEQRKIDLSLMKVLSHGKKAVNGQQLTKALGEIKSLGAGVIAAKSAEDYEKEMTALLKNLDKVVDTGKADDADTVAAIREHCKKVTSVAGATKPLGDDARYKGISDKVDVKGTDEILGNKSIVVKSPKDSNWENEFKRLALNTGIEIAATNAKFDINSSGSYETLSTSDASSIADLVADICDTIIAYKKGWEGREKQQKEMDTQVKRAVSSSEKDNDDSGTKSKIIKDVASAISVGWRRGVSFESSFINFAITVGRASLSYVERSLAQYKKA